MTNLEMLCYGIGHIAQNHKMRAHTDWTDGDALCIMGECNTPTLSDVQMLCDDVRLNRGAIGTTEFGIDVYLDEDWMDEWGDKEYGGGMELWHKTA